MIVSIVVNQSRDQVYKPKVVVPSKYVQQEYQVQPSSIARVCAEGFQKIPLMFGHLYFRVFDDYYKLSLVNQHKVYIFFFCT